MDKFIPLSVPNFEGNEKKYVNDAVEQGWVSTGGAYITKLEKDLATFLNVEEVAAVQSGTAALHLSLIDARVQPGDIVVVPTLTFIAAVNPVAYQFATPYFIDCDDSLCMDPVKLEKFCSEECCMVNGKLIHNQTEKKVKAIIVVHVFGNLADMEAIMNIAEKYNLKVIEDATEALGTKYVSGKFNGKYAGTIGDYGAYSFNGNKIITTGGGGALTAKDSEIVRHLRYLSTQAKDDPHFYIHNEIGYNYRMTNLQAALGVAQIEELPSFIERKQKNFDLYKKYFDNFKYGELLNFREGTDSNKWFYSLIINKEYINVSMRDIVVKLEDNGIGSRPIWGLIHEQIPYKESLTSKMDKALYYSSCVLNIPCSTNLNDDDILISASTIKKVLMELANE